MRLVRYVVHFNEAESLTWIIANKLGVTGELNAIVY